MIDFNDLSIVEAPAKQSVFSSVFVIGCEPLDQHECSPYNVYYVFNKNCGRKTLVMRTRKTFEQFVTFVTKNDIVKNYSISTKFINDAGRAKKYSEITDRYNGLQGDLTT